MKQTTIYFDEEDYRKLKHIVIEEDTSISELVRRLVSEFLESREEIKENA